MDKKVDNSTFKGKQKDDSNNNLNSNKYNIEEDEANKNNISKNYNKRKIRHYLKYYRE